jgi:hypothetical protein
LVAVVEVGTRRAERRGTVRVGVRVARPRQEAARVERHHARAAAGAAAWDAAWAALAPTVAELQASALALLDRMIEAKP